MRKKLGGSLTVEASLVLPVLVFAIGGLLFLIQILNIEQKIWFAMTQTVWEASEYGAVYEDLAGDGEGKNDEEGIMAGGGGEGSEESGGESSGESGGEGSGESGGEGGGESSGESGGEGSERKTDEGEASVVRKLVDGTFFHLAMGKYVDREMLDKSCILGGYEGISSYGSSFMEDGESIKMVLSYRVKIPFPMFSFLSFPIRQQIVSRAFIGEKEGDEEKSDTDNEKKAEDETVVYITETGTKYHKSKECTYLKPQISCVSFDGLESMRNASGGKYYACERCGVKGSEPELCYITKEGTRYHFTLSCSGLKRTVTAVSIEKAQDMGRTACSKCGG